MNININRKIKSKVISKGPSLVQDIEIQSFMDMAMALGGECYAYELPNNLLLWFNPLMQSNTFRDLHSVIIDKFGEESIRIYGNVILTSTCENDILYGIKSLEAKQFDWLGSRSSIICSEFHKELVVFIQLYEGEEIKGASSRIHNKLVYKEWN